MATFEYSALEYLDMWFLWERRHRDKVRDADEQTRLKGLSDGATYFRVARNMPTEYDIGIGQKRYEPVLRLIRSIETQPVSSGVGVDLVLSFARELAATYGKYDLLSAASKFMWLLYRDPVIIFDGQAWESLGRPRGYTDYVVAWEREWGHQKGSIVAACASLPNVYRYSLCGDQISRADVQSVIDEEWFHRRVLDVKLWVEGRSPGRVPPME